MTLASVNGSIGCSEIGTDPRLMSLMTGTLEKRVSHPKQDRSISVTDEKNPIKQDRNKFNQMIVKIAASQDRAAFADLYRHFAPRVKSFVLKGGITDQAAEEIAQETLLMVWRKAAQFDPQKAAASTWIFTIARNKRIDFHRRTNKPALKEDDFLHMASEDTTQDNTVEMEQASAATRTQLDKLPEEQKQVIQKAFMEEKSHAVVAEELGLPLGTVKSRIRIALRKLRGQLSDYE